MHWPQTFEQYCIHVCIYYSFLIILIIVEHNEHNGLMKVIYNHCDMHSVA